VGPTLQCRLCVKVKIKRVPEEREIDGVPLKTLIPGSVRDVSSTLGLWLIAEEYADSEMRSRSSDDDFDGLNPSGPFSPFERRGQKR
jgi:hypothetical protein